MDHEEDECLLLEKTIIYGLVQSARVFGDTYARVLEGFGFQRCEADPCLFTRTDEHGVCIILCYVDDNLVIGEKRAIEKLIKQLQGSELSITVEENLTDYLSCEILFNKEQDEAWLGQPRMIRKIIKTFAEEVKDLPQYFTPGTPGFGIVRQKTENHWKQMKNKKGLEVEWEC
jgi:hypothetical protein